MIDCRLVWRRKNSLNGEWSEEKENKKWELTGVVRGGFGYGVPRPARGAYNSAWVPRIVVSRHLSHHPKSRTPEKGMRLWRHSTSRVFSFLRVRTLLTIVMTRANGIFLACNNQICEFIFNLTRRGCRESSSFWPFKPVRLFSSFPLSLHPPHKKRQPWSSAPTKESKGEGNYFLNPWVNISLPVQRRA